jgi:glycerol-3-phosphate acyltransferase PlsX
MAASRIALDVMGGDNAPKATLGGALLACSRDGAALPPSRIVLVGDTPRMESMLRELGGNPGFELVHASQVIEMSDSPAQALRGKPDSSIAVSTRLVAEKKAGAVVGMGNTGACVAAATLSLGTLHGVKRPGIAVTLGLTGHPITLLDMGANIAPKAQHLVQYGAMGSIYMRDCLGIESPRVGLLNVGEEKGKGTDLLKEAYELFEGSGLSFVGNVEGRDLFRGICDVIVTDGFTGNVVLKLLEQFSTFMLGLVMKELEQHGAADWGKKSLQSVRKSIDYSSYGGALLLGVGGVVVIGHGRSDERAVANALALGARAIDSDVNTHIEQGLASRAELPGG